MKNTPILLTSIFIGVVRAFSPAVTSSACLSAVCSIGNTKLPSYSSLHAAADNNNGDDGLTTRRALFQCLAVVGVGVVLGGGPNAYAREMTDITSGELPELPPEAQRSYLQYRFGLQLAADFYLFDLQTMVADTDEYGSVADLVASKGARGGQGQPSRIEREFVNPMRIIGLSMPPEYADEIRDSQFAFERAMGKLTKATAGIRRDLPVEIDKSAVPDAKAAWEEGRLALNSFFVTLNTVTGLKDELKVIPPSGSNQFQEYGRSIRRYNDFIKKTKLCQNRGGPALSQAWGQLMVSGYLQDSCGVEPLEGYFFQ
ncbi:predicted protein [Thalassiosira pseudonana CCMP1335]|uniref:Uncharacterized protein n=1 Tax=Thalassiosira pseudonana TaxID=35128 RepID=B8CAE2_THAPS|nr:predicted protein [Thalassiosira pseudonana CCMP1335]EED89492.1 predicted protein [Thalassiosira pseudonana CCMP1335]